MERQDQQAVRTGALTGPMDMGAANPELTQSRLKIQVKKSWNRN